MMRRKKKKRREGKTFTKIIIGHVTAYTHDEPNVDFLKFLTPKKQNLQDQDAKIQIENQHHFVTTGIFILFINGIISMQ